MKKLIIKNICMNYHSLKGSTHTLTDITFDVKKGEFVSIIGPSGCGKSTLLNIIAGLLKPSFGEVYIDNELLTSFFSKIGYMFQKDQLFEWLTVWDNITIGLKIQHKLDAENKLHAEEMLTQYNLWDFRNHYPNELSGGMRQRAALIRTLILNPEVLLLDEPFSALDYQTRLNVNDDIYKILKKENKTVLMVTHDIPEAVCMSDKIIVLSKRPAKLKKIFDIQFPEDCNSPLKRRENKDFGFYFNEIWKELNSDDR